MRLKIITFLFLIIFCVPTVAGAIMMLPTASLTIVVNTQGQDANFVFDLKDCSTTVCDSPTQVNVQTTNLTGSAGASLVAFPGTQYSLTQENVKGLKIDSINCTTDNQEDVITPQTSGVLFSPSNGETITCTFNNVKTKTPVLFVPGLMGTNINKSNDKLWLDLAHNFTDIGDQFMDPLQFNQDLTPIDANLIIGSVIGKETVNVGVGNLTVFDYTDGIINEFTNRGYKEGETLFMFPYDWRYGVSGKYGDGKTNSDLLAQKIQDILTQTGSGKVDVVAHSMGGLIVKKYVAEHLADNKIGKAVFVGVPSTGAVAAVKALIQGDNFGIPWLADSEMKKIAANMPAAYDLLPSQAYYDAKGSYVETIDQTKCFDDLSIPCDVKDLNHQEASDFLNGQGFNGLAINAAETLHVSAFDNFDLRTAGIDLYAIDGCKSATMSKVIQTKYKTLLGQETSYDARFSAGDNTVPLESATNLPVDASHKFYFLKADHAKMLSQDGSRQEIVNLISGSALSVSESVITQDIARCKLNGKAISVFSPVNIFVTDQNGNRLGLADDGSVINEIPGASFEMLGEHKFVFLPTDNGQVYTTNLTGTGNGTFTIKSQDIVDSQTTKTEVFSNLPVTLELTGSVVINSADGATSLNIKKTPSVDTQIVLASAVLTGEDIEDYLAPSSLVSLTGDKDSNGIYTSKVVVGIKVSDAGSGILAMEYNLDNSGAQKVSADTADFTVSTEGKHTLTFFGTDKAGNNEAEQKIEFEIKFPPPVATGGGGGGGGNSYAPTVVISNSQVLISNENTAPPPAPAPAPIVEPAPVPVQVALGQPEPVKTEAEVKVVEARPPRSKVVDAGLPKPAENGSPQAPQDAAEKQNLFLASMGGFSNWFLSLWQKVIFWLSPT